MVSDRPVSGFRKGLPADRNSIVCALATQFWNGLPTGRLNGACAQGEAAVIVVGTPRAAQLATRFGPPPIWFPLQGSVTKPKFTLAVEYKSLRVGTRTDLE